MTRLVRKGESKSTVFPQSLHIVSRLCAKSLRGPSPSLSPYFSFIEEPPRCFPHWLNHFTFHQQCTDVLFFSTSLPTLVSSCLLDASHCSRCAVIFHYGFCLHFLIVMLRPFSCTCWSFVCFFWENFCSVPLSIF